MACADGLDPLGDLVETVPLDFSDPHGLQRSLEGAGVLYNTYWIRYARGSITFDKAVKSTGTLFEAAVRAGVGRIVHFSVTKPSHDSELPYFRGKAQVEDMPKDLGVPYAVIRPTLVCGDLLLNNMAWTLRRFPVFPVYGKGDYPVQPIYAEDLAAQAVEAGSKHENFVVDAAGPLDRTRTSRQDPVRWPSRGGVSQPDALSLANMELTPPRSHVVVCYSPLEPGYVCRAPQLLGVLFPSVGEQLRENSRQDTAVSYLYSGFLAQMLQRHVSRGARRAP